MRDEDGWDNCHFCGEEIKNGKDWRGKRHWLSDCRPDLVEHEPGPICTWWGDDKEEYDCYAYQDPWTREWGPEHKNFYKDGPM